MTGRAAQEIDAIISNSDDWRGDMLSRLRGIVLGAGPAVVEEVKWKKPSRPEGVPVWSLDGIVCIGEMLKNAVRLTFPKGAQIKDPKKLFNARLSSASVRAIDFYEGEDVPEAALKALILEAVGLNVSSKACERLPVGDDAAGAYAWSARSRRRWAPVSATPILTS
jgi:hypothetical protein